MVESRGEVLIKDALFEIQKWDLDHTRGVAPVGQFAVVCCLTGQLACANVDPSTGLKTSLTPGEFFLVPAQLQDRQLKPLAARTTLLRITIPDL
jgi:hypothetical protein